jgi:hypothetical protein
VKTRRISVLFILALIGLIASAALHFAAVAGLVADANAIQAPMAGGAILLAFAGVVVQHRRDTGLRELPHWLRAALLFFFMYAVLDLTLFGIDTRAGHVERDVSGQYVLKSDHDRVREASVQDYEHQRAWDTRVGTGMWMAFYALSAAMLWIPRRRGEPEVPAATVRG